MIINGKSIADQIQREIHQAVTQLPGRKPCLSVIIVGDNSASLIYVSRKAKACQNVGIESREHSLPSDVSSKKLIDLIEKLNQDPTVDGILIQLPLPPHLNPTEIISHLSPKKDVDGLHPLNLGKLLIGDLHTTGFVPCTPLGIHILLQRLQIEVSGKHVVILGRSNIVGKPLAALLMQNTPEANATVTIAHSRTRNIKELCKSADIIVAAMGQPKFITDDMVTPGVVIIDVGINRIASETAPNGYQIIGDVDFDKLKEISSWITPVPGGVGPMTIAMLLSNTLKSYLTHFNS